jgi:SAM-dependent methyltransferase
MLGMHGTRAANYAMDEADLICAIGARFDDRITGKLAEFAPRAKFIHIDIDPAEIGKNVPAHIPIVGDARHVLAKLNIEYRALEADAGRLDEWWQRVDGWRDKHPLRYEDSESSEIKPQYMIEALYEATGGDAIVTSDVGQHQMWTAQYFHFQGPRKWINSGGLGTMGFGLPAAMGAAVGCPDKTVVCVSGDGSFQMNAQELATCADNGIPVKAFVMNNGYLGMVRQWQELFWDGRYSQVKMGGNPDFVKLAEAYGCTGIRLSDKATLVEDMREALATPGPVVVDVPVSAEENVYPMRARSPSRAGGARPDGAAASRGRAVGLRRALLPRVVHRPRRVVGVGGRTPDPAVRRVAGPRRPPRRRGARRPRARAAASCSPSRSQRGGRAGDRRRVLGRRGRAGARDRRPRAEVLLADARAVPLPDGVADLVTLLDVAEHLSADELAAALAQARRLLRPGGRLFLHTFPTSTYYAVTYRVLRRVFGPTGWPADPRNAFEHAMHVNEQSARRLRRALRDAGFARPKVWHGAWVHDGVLPDLRARRSRTRWPPGG